MKTKAEIEAWARKVVPEAAAAGSRKLREYTVQDCPKHYLHHAGEICRKCGRKGKPVAKNSQPQKITIKQKPEAPVESEILAEAIVRLAGGMQRLTKSGLNRVAIEALLHDDTKIARRDITRILDSLETLARKYTR